MATHLTVLPFILTSICLGGASDALLAQEILPQINRTPSIKRPDKNPVDVDKRLQQQYDALWDAYELRIDSSSQLFVSLSEHFLKSSPWPNTNPAIHSRTVAQSAPELQNTLNRFRETGDLGVIPPRRSGRSYYPPEDDWSNDRGLSVKEGDVHGRIPLSFSNDWPSKITRELVPQIALHLWIRREYRQAIQQLEKDYESLSASCEIAGRVTAARTLRKEIGLLLDAEWSNQEARVRAFDEEFVDRQRKAVDEAAAWKRKQAMKAGNGGGQGDAARRNEESIEDNRAIRRGEENDVDKLLVEQKELVDGKPYIASSKRATNLITSLRNSKWTDGQSMVVQWDRSGRLWVKQGGMRYFVYAEYGDSDECVVRSDHVDIAKFKIERSEKRIIPFRASGRKLRELTRVED